MEYQIFMSRPERIWSQVRASLPFVSSLDAQSRIKDLDRATIQAWRHSKRSRSKCLGCFFQRWLKLSDCCHHRQNDLRDQTAIAAQH